MHEGRAALADILVNAGGKSSNLYKVNIAKKKTIRYVVALEFVAMNFSIIIEVMVFVTCYLCSNCYFVFILSIFYKLRFAF